MKTTSLSDVEAFLAVAELHSFSKAAQELGIAQSTMSRRIANLETRLAQQLVMRTTRRVTLTDAGSSYAAELRDVVARLETADARLQNRSMEPQGVLRVTMPTAFGRVCVLPCIAQLANRYPKLRFEVDLSDRYVDLLDGRFDVAIRLNAPEHSGVQAERLCSFGAILCASPAYLDARGRPQVPGDLDAHSCLAFRTYAPQVNWSVLWKGRQMDLKITPRLSVSDATALRVLTLDGIGLAVLPSYLAVPDLREGRLVEALPGMTFADLAMFVAYPRHSVNLAKVVVLLDVLRAGLPAHLVGGTNAVLEAPSQRPAGIASTFHRRDG